MNNDGAIENDFRQMFIVMGAIAVFLIGLILIGDAADRDRLASNHFFVEVTVSNATARPISVWVRRGLEPPEPGSSITEYRDLDCGPPECGIASGATRSWQVDLKTESDYPPLQVVAWTGDSGEVLYMSEHSITDLNANGWSFRVTDQR